jgi:hypothetical protein
VSVLETEVTQEVTDGCVAGLRHGEDILRLLSVEDHDGKGGLDCGFGDDLEMIDTMRIFLLPLQKALLFLLNFLHILRQLH